MKQVVLATILLAGNFCLHAQNYPDPEFNNEVCFLKKDSIYTTVRLEKETSKLESKTRGVGFGGSESGYSFEGGRSMVRLSSGKNLSFIYTTSSVSGSYSGSDVSDSTMRANGVDPSMLQGLGDMTDPASSFTLYRVESSKGVRKIILQKIGGAFGAHKIQSSDKYTFSVKKIREGYWLFLVDKSLPPGEYAFAMLNYMGGGIGGDQLIFAFGID